MSAGRRRFRRVRRSSFSTNHWHSVRVRRRHDLCSGTGSIPNAHRRQNPERRHRSVPPPVSPIRRPVRPRGSRRPNAARDYGHAWDRCEDAPADAPVFGRPPGISPAGLMCSRAARWRPGGHLDVAVAGGGRAGWPLDQLSRRGRRPVVEGSVAAGPRGLCPAVRPVRYVDGDYTDASTFAAVRRELGSAVAPGPLPAIPRRSSAPSSNDWRPRGARRGARVSGREALRPRSRHRARANRIVLGTHSPSGDIFPRSITTSANGRCTTAVRPLLESDARGRSEPDSGKLQLTMSEDFGIARTRSFYGATGVVRDVVQHHRLPGAEQPARGAAGTDGAESLRERKGQGPEVDSAAGGPRRRSSAQFRAPQRVLAAPPVRGRDLRARSGCASTRGGGRASRSDIRTGKCLPVTATEVVVRAAPAAYGLSEPRSRRRTTSASVFFRARDRRSALQAMDDADLMIGKRVELVRAAGSPTPTSAPRTSVC